MAATILCADVDRHLFKIVERALRGHGYRAVAAYDGDQALAMVRDESPSLVLLDINLPKRDGFEVLEAIRKLDGPAADTPVLLTSSSRISPQYEERANALGAQGLVAKPIALDDLLTRVRAHVKPSVPLSSRDAKRGTSARVEGDLAEIEFAQLLHRLHGLRATGVLMIHSGKKKKAIQLRDGYPVAVKSNLVDECLGNHLVRLGKLTPAALAESVARME